jgi:hypothetical protein
MSNLEINYCGGVTKNGDNCSRKALSGHTMCKQHLDVTAKNNELAMKRKAEQEAHDAYLQKCREESAKKAVKRGTDEQRAKFRSDVLAAWNATKPVLTEDENAFDGYNSDLCIEEDGVGVCSTCGKTNYCVKVNHGQVFCADNNDCGYDKYNWFYDSPTNYPEEIPEEYRM